MLNSDTISFSLIEWLTLTGLAQCLFVFVYTIFRVKSWSRTILVLSYFFVIAASFMLQFSLRLEDYQQEIRLLQWVSWLATPPLCYLLVLQVAKDKIPSVGELFVLAAIPVVVLLGFILKDYSSICEVQHSICKELLDWFYWMSSLSGMAMMLLLWFHRDIFGDLWRNEAGREKYWLVMVLITANVVIITVNLLRTTDMLSVVDADSILTLMGMMFVYLAATTMFRVYPPPVALNHTPQLIVKELSESEQELSGKIEKLMELDKLYHDPKFDRSALARELEVSEGVISRVINVAFDKSFPRFLAEYRVADAKRMLENPDIAINVVASEVGFNSIASFNRIFREVEGVTPSQYRQSVVGADKS